MVTVSLIVSWLCACVKYWPNRGVGRCASLLSVGIIILLYINSASRLWNNIVDVLHKKNMSPFISFDFFNSYNLYIK